MRLLLTCGVFTGGIFTQQQICRSLHRYLSSIDQNCATNAELPYCVGCTDCYSKTLCNAPVVMSDDKEGIPRMRSPRHGTALLSRPPCPPSPPPSRRKLRKLTMVQQCNLKRTASSESMDLHLFYRFHVIVWDLVDPSMSPVWPRIHIQHHLPCLTVTGPREHGEQDRETMSWFTSQSAIENYLIN